MPIEAMFDTDAPTLTFTYKDATHQVSDRTVEPLGVIQMKNGQPGIRALCQLRDALRTFEIGRILHIAGVGGAPASGGWGDLAKVVEEPAARLALAQSYTYDVMAGKGRSAPMGVTDIMIRAQEVLTDVDKSLHTAIAWRDKEGRPKLDIDVNAAGALMEGSAHLRMRRRGTLFLAGEALLNLAPVDCPYVAWHQGCAAWYSVPDRRWIPFPPSP